MGKGIRYTDADIKKQYEIIHELMSCGLSFRRACMSARVNPITLVKRMTKKQKENLIILKHIALDFNDINL